MPKLKHRVKPSPLHTLRRERAQAEEWLRGAVEDFIDHPKNIPLLLEHLENDCLPLYRTAYMRVRKAERKGTRG
jgi:hypothetical protein